MQYKILFVDDETANLRLLERLFRTSYEVFTASSGEEGLEILAVHDIALILSDQRMPGMSGSDFLKRAAEMRPQTVRMMLTGYTDANDLVDAINSGVVYKYITKPWVNEELRQTVKRALQHYESTKAQRQLQLQCERLNMRLRATKKGVASIVAAMMEDRFPGVQSSGSRTAALAVAVAEKFGLDWQERETLELAAQLYDAVLFRAPGAVGSAQDPGAGGSSAALAAALEHGSATFEAVADLEDAVGVLRYRFEKFDGTGFPTGFAGAQIPAATRILVAAAFYEKLRFPWFGAQPLDHVDAVRTLREHAGRELDPEMVDAISQVAEYMPEFESVQTPVLA